MAMAWVNGSDNTIRAERPDLETGKRDYCVGVDVGMEKRRSFDVEVNADIGYLQAPVAEL
jgi:hypothetical protein